MKNKLLFYYFLTLCALLSARGITAQDYAQIHQFTLKQAQEYALDNNLTVKNAELDVDIAQKKVWETTAIGLPQVSGSVGHTNNLTIPTSLFPNFIEPTILQVLVDQGILPGSALDNLGEPDLVEVKFGTQYNANYGINIDQLIFSGPYIVGLQASRIYRSLSEQSYEKTEESIKELIAQNYYLILLSENTKKNLENNFINMKKIYNETKALYEAGFVEQIDVNQLKINLTSIKNSLSAMERQINVTYNLFKFQLGMNLDASITLTENLETILESIDLEAFINQTFDSSSHIDYKLIDTQEKLAKLNFKKEKSEYLPTLSAFYSYQENAMRDEFNFFDSDKIWYPSQILGFNLNIPIFSSGQKRSRVSQRKIEFAKAQNIKNLTIESLNLEFQQAKFDYKTALEKYYNQKESITTTKDILDKTSIKFKEGMVSSLELTQTNNQYLNTQSEYTQTIVELLNAKIRLDKALSKL